jgi:hypothetical protein
MNARTFSGLSPGAAFWGTKIQMGFQIAVNLGRTDRDLGLAISVLSGIVAAYLASRGQISSARVRVIKEPALPAGCSSLAQTLFHRPAEVMA